jgi:hypothetical protein
MPRIAKLLIGLAAALAAAWLSHGPLGRGEAFVAMLETRAQAVVAQQGVAGVTVRMQRDPLRRVAILSGPANDFQRNGMGSLPGLNQRVAAVSGIGSVEWANAPPGAP